MNSSTKYGKYKKYLSIFCMVAGLAAGSFTNFENGIAKTATETGLMQAYAAESREDAYTEEDLKYLSAIIYCEARGEEYKGKLAVANVILNRVKSDIFDHVATVREVIYDMDRWGCQFSPAYIKKNGRWTAKGAPMEEAIKIYEGSVKSSTAEQAQMEECIKAAKAVLNGKRAVSEKVLYFNSNIRTTKVKCKKQGIAYVVIGNHIFYRAD